MFDVNIMQFNKYTPYIKIQAITNPFNSFKFHKILLSSLVTKWLIILNVLVSPIIIYLSSEIVLCLSLFNFAIII